MVGAAKDVVVYDVPQLGGKAEKGEVRSFQTLTGRKSSIENCTNRNCKRLTLEHAWSRFQFQLLYAFV